jgi:surface antigen
MKQALAAMAVLTSLVVGPTPAKATNCVAYVKSVTGLDIYGDAWQWWGGASARYERGFAPAPGAVMVFSRTGRMHVGHVAVVRQIVGSREILIDHANWHHGRVDRGVSIHDLSPNNDWSSVEVEWSKGVYGGPFPITGFVYAPGTPPAAPIFRERQEPHLVEASNEMRHGSVVLAGGRTMLRQHGEVKSANRPAPTATVQHAASRHVVPVAASVKSVKPAIVKKPAAAAKHTGNSH